MIFLEFIDVFMHVSGYVAWLVGLFCTLMFIKDERKDAAESELNSKIDKAIEAHCRDSRYHKHSYRPTCWEDVYG